MQARADQTIEGHEALAAQVKTLGECHWADRNLNYGDTSCESWLCESWLWSSI